MVQIEELVFNFIFEESMNDATRRTEAASAKSYVMPLDGVKIALKEYFNSIVNMCLSDTNNDSLDDKFQTGKSLFESCAKSIIKAINTSDINEASKNCFTFGNIQKLITMTMKRYYIRYYDSERVVGFDYCFCPMDMRMRNKVAQKYFEVFGKRVQYNNECAWSKMRENGTGKYDINNFWNYQKAIDELVTRCNYRNRLEMDYYLFPNVYD